MIRPGSGNPDFGIQEYFRVITGIVVFGIRNPANDWKSQIQVPVITSTESTACNPESKTVLDYLTLPLS